MSVGRIRIAVHAPIRYRGTRELTTSRVLRAASAFICGLSFIGSAAHGTRPNPDSSATRLVILVSVDQFSADLFNANRQRFRHGFKRLSTGALYSNAYFAHGVTETCAGHAVLVTGRDPRDNGIVSNNWFDPATGSQRYCTDDGQGVAALETRPKGVGPGLLAVDTVGDWLRKSQPTAKIFSVAGKDRAAIMMAGRSADGAFWLNGSNLFDTWDSNQAAAQSRLEPLMKLNSEIGRKLPALKSPWTYADPKCRRLEREFVLPHGGKLKAALPPAAPSPVPGFPISAKEEIPGWAFDELTLDAAYALVRSGDLGQDAVPDFLAIGLSGTDIVGHAYGPSGPEMCDHLFRLDRALGRFFDQIDKLHLNYAVVLTADHGGGDMMVQLAQEGFPEAKHLDANDFIKALNMKIVAKAALDWAPLRPSGFDITQLVIVGSDGKPLADRAFAARIARMAADEAIASPDVVGAWTRGDLETHRVDARLYPALLTLEDRMALSQYPARGSDVILALRPLLAGAPALPGRYMMGHSGPSDYDRRVPIMIWRPGSEGREIAMIVPMTSVTPTLLNMLGISGDLGLPGNSLEGR